MERADRSDPEDADAQYLLGARYLRAHLQWVVRSYDIIASENDCKRLKPLAVRLAPPDQPTTCGDLTRTFWLVHH